MNRPGSATGCRRGGSYRNHFLKLSAQLRRFPALVVLRLDLHYMEGSSTFHSDDLPARAGHWGFLGGANRRHRYTSRLIPTRMLWGDIQYADPCREPNMTRASWYYRDPCRAGADQGKQV